MGSEVSRAPERIWAADQKYAEGIEGSWHVDSSTYGGSEYIRADLHEGLLRAADELAEAVQARSCIENMGHIDAALASYKKAKEKLG